ncbi:MAG: hypothetical protein QOI04_81 [Verrucomicrobiota bacterium]|jgi:hypothetical protein
MSKRDAAANPSSKWPSFSFWSVTLTLAIGLTLFYFVHEGLPRFARAPSAMLLAPVAIVDGLCNAVGISGIYGKLIPIFFVNFIFAIILCALGCLARNLWRHRAMHSEENDR